MAIGEGLDAIRLGRADVMLCGGTEAPITQSASPASARCARSRGGTTIRSGESRPFDAARDGFVMGEAGAILVLEALDHARARGAKIYAELLGYGISSDATHITEPDPTGESPARAMQMAFDDAGVEPRRSATSTRTDLDAARRRERDARDQARARRGARAREIPISSTKGATGHMPRGRRRGRGDLHDARASSDGIVPPTINYEEPDPECDLDYIPNESREVADLRYGSPTPSGSAVTTRAIVVGKWTE